MKSTADTLQIGYGFEQVILKWEFGLSGLRLTQADQDRPVHNSVCAANGCFLPIFTASGHGYGAGFCTHNRFLNKDLMQPNKCLPQSVMNHLLFSPLLLLYLYSLSLVSPPLCARRHHGGGVSIQAGPPGASLLSLTHQPNSLVTVLSAFPAPFFPLSPPLSLQLIPGNWTHSGSSLRPGGIFSLASHLIFSASLNPQESIIN